MKKLLIGTAVAVAFLAPSAGFAFADTVVYNSIPSPQPGNVVSEAFEAQSVDQYGGQIELAGTDRTNPVVTVLMSSWGCEGGSWYNGNCVSTLGDTFSEPITLNIYNVGAGNSVGSLITSETQTFDIPYRPSADNVNCTGPNAGEWYNGSNCYNGFATPITFNALTGTTLPDNVIVSVSYNTSDYGPSPYGDSTACHATPEGCGYDSLNVGTSPSASVGSIPDPSDAYLDSSLLDPTANPPVGYCDGGAGGINVFRLDAGCWTGYQPAIEVQAIGPSVTTNSVTGETMTDATLNGTNGPVDAQAESFWVSTSPIDTSSATIPVGVYSTLPIAGVTASQSFSADLAAMTAPNGAYVNGQVLGSMPAVVPGTTYYVVAWTEVGGNWYPGQVLSFVAPLAAGLCPAGTVQSKSPLETVTVNSNLDTATASSHVLASGQPYLLVASGTWQNGGLNVVDPMYASLNSWATYQEGYDTTPYFLGPEEFNLETNGAFTNWGPYNGTSHSYSYLYTGSGSKANFLVFDGNSNNGVSGINPAWYGDNSGALSVAIYQCTKPNTVTVSNTNNATITVTTTSSSNSGGNVVTGNSGGSLGGKGGSTSIKTGPAISTSKSITIVNTNFTSVKKH